MRIRSDEAFAAMDRDKIVHELQQLNEFKSNNQNMEKSDLLHKLKLLERTRHLMCWHDGATIGGHSYIVITISVMYDVAAFLSD